MSNIRIVTEEGGVPKAVYVDGVILPRVFDIWLEFNLTGKSVLKIVRYKTDSDGTAPLSNGVKPLTIYEDFLLDSLVIERDRKEI